MNINLNCMNSDVARYSTSYIYVFIESCLRYAILARYNKRYLNYCPIFYSIFYYIHAINRYRKPKRKENLKM